MVDEGYFFKDEFGGIVEDFEGFGCVDNVVVVYGYEEIGFKFFNFW